MDILLPLFQLLYFVAHFLVSLALSVVDTFHVLHRHLLRLYYWLRSEGISSYRMQADASMLKKKPEHIGIIFIGRNVNCIPNLITLISWCVGYDIRYISLYDTHGILKQKRSNFIKSLEKIGMGVNFSVVAHNVDCQHTKECVCVTDNKDHIGGVTLPLITVNLLSIGDGKGDLMTAARKLCSTETHISQSMVERSLLTCGQPDPEAVVIVGEPMTNLGFLPWQIRLSEFFEVPSLVRFEYNEFRTVMEKYSKCEQRCGK